jgi:hypothetical protein
LVQSARKWFHYSEAIAPDGYLTAVVVALCPGVLPVIFAMFLSPGRRMSKTINPVALITDS